jgi:chromosome partitioning protein
MTKARGSKNNCISIINQKGGVGKSTTALALGAGLTRIGFKVLYIDLDAQGNLTYALGASRDTGLTAFEVLTKRIEIHDVIQSTPQGDIIPASPALAGADTVINEVGKEYRLREALGFIKGTYHYVVIDTPPALGILTINALTACKRIIIPAQADIFSLQGIGQLHSTIKTVKRYCNPYLKVEGILLTRFNSRAVLSRDVAQMIDQAAKQLRTRLFRTTIREAIVVKEAQAMQQDIFSYAPQGKATEDYRNFIKELLERS